MSTWTLWAKAEVHLFVGVWLRFLAARVCYIHIFSYILGNYEGAGLADIIYIPEKHQNITQVPCLPAPKPCSEAMYPGEVQRLLRQEGLHDLPAPQTAPGRLGQFT